jgi:hypothetical protein
LGHEAATTAVARATAYWNDGEKADDERAMDGFGLMVGAASRATFSRLMRKQKARETYNLKAATKARKVEQELRKDAMFAEGEKHYKSGAFL